MSNLRETNFNIKPLLNELNDVIEQGLNDILHNFIGDYNKYKEGYEDIMKLPFIQKLSTQKNNFSDDFLYNDLFTYDVSCNKISINNKIPLHRFISNLPIANNYKNEPKHSHVNEEFNLELKKIRQEIEENNNKQNKSIDLLFNKINELVDCNISLISRLNELKNNISQVKQDTTTPAEENIFLKIEECNNVTTESSKIDNIKEENISNNISEESTEPNIDDNDTTDVESETEMVYEDEKVIDKIEITNCQPILEETTEESEENESEEEESEEEEIDEEEEEEEVIPEPTKIEESKEEEGEEEEFFEIEIDDITYYTNNEESGIIYEVTKDEDIGKAVGYLKEGEPFFY
jgi:hypothetical protein